MNSLFDAIDDALWEPEKKDSPKYTAEHRAIADAIVSKAKAGDLQAAAMVIDLLKTKPQEPAN